MARLPFGGDDVFVPGPYGTAKLNATGRTAVFYTDEAGTTLADISLTSGGASISGSSLVVNADSQVPAFYGPPDGSDTLYVSVAGHAPVAVYTNVDTRLDGLTATVGQKAATTYVDAQDATTLSTAESFATSAVASEASARAAADGTRLNWRGAWAATTAYATNDAVSYLGGFYRALTGFTSGGSFNAANWHEIVPQSGTYALTDQPFGKSTIPAWTPPTALLTDQFERTSATVPGTPDIGPAWSALSGTWGTNGHSLYLVTHGAGTWDLVAADLGKANVVISPQLVFGASPDAGVAVRVIDANNFFAVECVDSTFNIFKVDGGVATQVATITLGRIVADGGTTNTSKNVTSLTANFTAADIGLPLVSSSGVPANTGIANTYTTSTAPAWIASTAYAVGDVVRPTTANGHMYQVTVAGTSGSSEPAWPTNGTTVVNGGVTFKDLGAVTAAVLSAAATSTGTGRTFTIGSSTKSGTHSIEVCADLDTIGVMVDSVQILAYDMTGGEWAKYGTATKHGAWTTGTAEGTVWRRFYAWPVTQRGFYNGRVSAGTYSIGRAATADGRAWYKKLNPVITSGAGGSWDSGNILDPWCIVVGGTVYLYYDGTGGDGKVQIGLATSTDWVTWTKNAANPLIAKGPSGSIDESQTKFSIVMYDADDSDAGQRWKMWYTGFPVGDKSALCYAYSTDGITWTKWSGNPVLDSSLSPFDIDMFSLSGTGVVFKTGSLWHMLSGPFMASGNQSICHATFTNPKSRYSKDPSNPVAPPRRVSQMLTADLGIGSKVVTVANTAVFVQGEPVVIDIGAAGGANGFLTRIQTIDSPTQLTLRDFAKTSALTVAASASIRSAFHGGVTPRALFQLPNSGRYRLFTTSFAVYTSGPLEFTTVYDSASPTGPFFPGHGQGVVLPLGGSSTWDTVSAENATVVNVTAA